MNTCYWQLEKERLTHSLEGLSSYTAEATHSLKKKKLNEEEKVRRDGGAGTQILRRTYAGMQNSRHAERCIMTG